MIDSAARRREIDCLILGGGITGAGVARDAAMRGLRVMLVDSHDFASGTSHLTSKLVHGGLRYLEHGRFRLVMEGIVERDRLLNRLAPTLVFPLRFVIPFEPTQVPKWLFTVAGLQFYGFIEWIRGGRRSTYMLRRQLKRRYPHLRDSTMAASFWDAQTNDARLVISTLRTARVAGAELHNYTKITAARFEGGAWTVDLYCPVEAREWTVRTRSVVNATGPWSPLTAERFGAPHAELMWIKGSHIVMRRPERFGRDAIVIRSVLNRRPLWVVPWYHRLIVGSTESMYAGELRNVRASPEEIEDLFESVRRWFPSWSVTRGDICGAYAGVRPIIDQASESANRASREHRIETDAARGIITISGGKLTTFRRMAEQTVDAVEAMLHRGRTADALRKRLRREPLWPRMSRKGAAGMHKALAPRARHLDIGPNQLAHLVGHYGEDASLILADVAIDRRSGRPLIDGLPHCLAEVAYLCRHEHVRHLVDVMKRRMPMYFLADLASLERVVPMMAETVGVALGWDSARCDREGDMLMNDHASDLGGLGSTASTVDDLVHAQMAPTEPARAGS